MTEDKQASRGRGCLFYGLLTMALVFVGVLAGIYFGTRKAVRYAIETYTTNAPAPIPILQIPPDQQRAIANALLRQFEASVNKRGPADLTVDEDELNVLISQTAELRAFKSHVYLQPQGEELKAFVSLPLDQFRQWQEFSLKMGGTNYTGRYFNGLVYMNLVVTNGTLNLVPRKMIVSAKSLPDEFLKQFPWRTLTQPMNENSNVRSALQRVDSVTIHDSKVHVKLKP